MQSKSFRPAIIVLLLLAMLACSFGNKSTETPTPTAPVAAATEKPTKAPTEAPTTAPAPAIELGDAQRNETGGFAYRTVPGYELAEYGGMVNLLAPGADPDVGPVITLGGWINEEEKTNADLYDQLIRDSDMTVGEAEEITIQGIPALVTGISGDTNGTAIQGRVALVMVTPTQQFILLAGAPVDQWAEMAPTFDALLASIEFFEPVLPPPTSNIESGMYAYVNNNVVRDVVVYQDTLYAATLGGMVTRNLDGSSPQHYTPLNGMGHVSSNAIAACEIFGNERIVVGLLDGLSLFDPETITWDNTPVTPEDSQVSTSKVTRLYCDREQRWLLIGYNGLGVLDIDGGDFERFTTKEGLSWDGVSDIAVNGSDIWVASGYNGITKISGGEVTVYNVASGMPDERANALAFAPDGTLWVGGSKGLMKFSGGQWTLYDVIKDINEVEIATDGSVWAASAPLGAGHLCLFDPQTERCSVDYQDMDGQAILTLTLDPQGRAIYGTNKGYTIFDAASSAYPTSYVDEDAQLMSNFVDAIVTAPDGLVWVGTDGGLQVLDPAVIDLPWASYRKSDTPGLGGSWGHEIAVAPDGTIWVAVTNGDASRFSNGTWTSFPDLRSYDSVAVDAQGRAWFGDDSKGIVVLNADGSAAMQLTTADGLPSDKVQALLADGDTIWIALDIGLAKYSNGNVELVLDKNILPHPYLRTLALDASGTLLIGANLSIVRYDGSDTELLINFQKEGYMDWLTTLAVSPDGRIWAGTANGLFYSDDGTLWDRMTTADGLLTNFISALHADAYGAVWVGGGGSNYDGGGLLYLMP